MAPQKENSISKVNLLASIGQTFWTVLVGAGVFFATMYSTQSVVNTRLNYMEGEISALKSNDVKISDDISKLDTRQNALLLDISNRLRDMEIRLSELQVKVLIALDQKDNLKKPEPIAGSK